MIPAIAEQYAGMIAQALVQGQANMRPVAVDASTFHLTGVTQNRRCHISPFVQCDSIDPNLGILRVDDASTQKTMAILWNYAMHGTCFGSSNLEQSGDLMGMANVVAEAQLGGAIVLFQNADAGDIDPLYARMCNGDPSKWAGPAILASAIIGASNQLAPQTTGSLAVVSAVTDFGPVVLNATLERFNNCSSGGPLDICSICRILDCHANPPLQSGWVATTPRFTAVRLDVGSGGKSSNIFVTVPGEALLELGWLIRNDTQKLGFTHTFFTGYSQEHMGYFAPPDEYIVGGYESQLTLWGIDTALKVRSQVYQMASKLVQ